MLLSSAVPCLLVLPLRATLTESPLWLTNHGYGDRAAAIVRRKLGANVSPPLATPVAATSHGRWRRLFALGCRRNTLVGCTFFTSLNFFWRNWARRFQPPYKAMPAGNSALIPH